jgi:hypothetical protein
MITPELAEVIQEAIDSALIDVHTALPGAVQSYDAATKTVDVELQTKRMLEKQDGTFTSEELPILVNVPIAYQGSSDYVTAYALAPGDTGMVMFSETSLDQWRSKGSVTSPSDIERHGLSGAVFYPAPLPIAKIVADVLTTGAFFGKKAGCQLRATGTTMEVTTAGAATSVGGFVALATKVDALWAALDTVIRTAWIVAPNDGGAALKAAYTAAFPTPPATVTSTNLKAD